MDPTHMQNKVAAAEGVRGTACFMVVFSHISLSFFPYLHAFNPSHLNRYRFEAVIHDSPFSFFFSGTAAVYIFFVLSGYVLTYAASRGRDQTTKIKIMTIKRYPRLMIPALGSCLLLWFAFTFFRPDGRLLSEWINEFGEHPGSLADPIYDGIFRIFWTGYSSYNWVLWTMKIELVGSLLVFGLLYAKTARCSLYWTVPLGLSLSYIATHLVPLDIDSLQNTSIPDFFENNLAMLCFLFGMLFFSSFVF